MTTIFSSFAIHFVIAVGRGGQNHSRGGEKQNLWFVDSRERESLLFDFGTGDSLIVEGGKYLSLEDGGGGECLPSRTVSSMLS